MPWLLRRLASRLRGRLTDRWQTWQSRVDLLWQWVVYLVVGRLSTFWSRDQRLWVFGAHAGRDFVDNAKYLYLWTAANRPSIRPVWLSRNDTVVETLQKQGYEAYHATSLRGRYLTLRAGVVAVTHGLRDVHMGSTAGAMLVQLWHGLPLKTVAWDAEWADEPWLVRRCHEYMAAEIDLVTVPSTEAIEPLSSGLGVDPDRFVVTGYPRTDVFADCEGATLTVDDGRIKAIKDRASDSQTVFYLPTFRGSEGTSFVEAFDTAAIGARLTACDAHLYIKAHPSEPVTAAADHPRIHWLPSSVDPYLVLPHANVLVTDYSSVFFDYLAVDRPIVFFAYDRSAYAAHRGFYFEYDEITPGPIVSDSKSLATALNDAVSAAAGGDDPYATDRRRLRSRFCPVPSGTASETVFEAISTLVFDESLASVSTETTHDRSRSNPALNKHTYDRF